MLFVCISTVLVDKVCVIYFEYMTADVTQSPAPGASKTRNIFIVIIIVLVLAGAIGYAYFNGILGNTVPDVTNTPSATDPMVMPNSPAAQEAFKEDAVEYLEQNAPSKEEVDSARDILLQRMQENAGQ